jgi:flagellin-like hook-associated protein FlgL
MIGAMSSSLSLAQRTASKARATMDDMTRQIATGQRVSSVKDDGAAWTRAAGLRSDQVQWEGRAQTLERVELGLEATRVAHEAVRLQLDRLGELIISARAFAPGSSARAALQAEWSAFAAATPSGGTNPAFDNSTGHAIDGLGIGFQMNTTDPFFSGTRFAALSHLDGFGQWTAMAANAGQGRPVQLSTFDLLNASTSQLDDATTSVNTLRGRTSFSWLSAWEIETGGDLRQVETLRSMTEAATMRLETQIGALTDADLGKASTARSNAETRQQLALSTIQQAISAYGNFAGGLLGNVQRTQRGLLA